MKKIHIHKGKLNLIEMAYILVPLLLFLLGWTKWYIAGLCVSVAAICYKKLFKEFWQKEDVIDVSSHVLVVGGLLLLFIGYSCGWGRWVKQPAIDYEKHNAILADLTSQSWPVYYDTGNEHAMLTYYIGQYLVPAFVGKISGSFRIAEILVFIWSSLGLILVWAHMICSLNISGSKRQLGSAVFLILFSLPLFLAKAIGESLGLPIHSSPVNTDWFSRVSEVGIHIQYSSNYVLLNWAYPQTIVCWITTLLLIDYKDKIQFYIPLVLPSMLFSALSFVGLVLFAATYAIVDLVGNQHVKEWLKKVFSTENIFFFVTVGSVLLLYYWGNVFSDKPEEMRFYLSPVVKTPMLFLVFYLFCVLPYPICLLRWCKKDTLFWIATGILVLLPLVHLGVANDLMMRASIPALFIIMYKIVYVGNNYLTKENKGFLKKIKNNGKKTILIAVFILFLFYGALYPITNIIMNIRTSRGFMTTTLYTWGTAGIYADRSLKDGEEERINEKIYNYFTYDVEETVFYRVIARKKMSNKRNIEKDIK